MPVAPQALSAARQKSFTHSRACWALPMSPVPAVNTTQRHSQVTSMGRQSPLQQRRKTLASHSPCPHPHPLHRYIINRTKKNIGRPVTCILLPFPPAWVSFQLSDSLGYLTHKNKTRQHLGLHELSEDTFGVATGQCQRYPSRGDTRSDKPVETGAISVAKEPPFIFILLHCIPRHTLSALFYSSSTYSSYNDSSPSGFLTYATCHRWVTHRNGCHVTSGMGWAVRIPSDFTSGGRKEIRVQG